MSRNISDILKEHTFDLDIEDDAIVTNVVLVIRTMRLEGDTTLSHCPDTGTDWIVKLGMLTAAQADASASQREYIEFDDDDDDK